MKWTVLALLTFAATGLPVQAAHTQQTDKQQLNKATAEDFLQKIREDLAGFIMVLPASTAAEGEWKFGVALVKDEKPLFERSFTMAAVKTTWSIPGADEVRAQSYRFDIPQAVPDIIDETEAALKTVVEKYGKGTGSFELKILPPEGFLAGTHQSVCSSDKPLYFDLFFEAPASGRLTRVEFTDELRTFLGMTFKSSCYSAPSDQAHDPV
ncbi:MAG TPA: hypothetical protein VFV70_07635 [Hyphomonadaceae bacterium]|nr:hypothetical protein [Hyphomonadaceae bacterium]